ncbi:hypothetical protein [Methanoculleus frigidifontis]|uniref:hypothetical protein n=1 Tax=Methanoculleus frigidifontis TaxID=2584085 RepID=UPI00265B6EE2|nr:hypothetical protein [Methanoculleus sp. FWC-SCC1]
MPINYPVKCGFCIKFISKPIVGRYIPPREGGVTLMAAKDKKAQAQEKKQGKQEKGKKN